MKTKLFDRVFYHSYDGKLVNGEIFDKYVPDDTESSGD